MKRTLIDVFPFWMTDGIFSRMTWAPWANDENIDAHALDIEYFGNRSGDALVSPLVEKMTAQADGTNISDAQVERLLAILKARYRENWSRLWYALSLDYNPIENFDSEEDENIGSDVSVSSKTKTKNEGTVIPFGSPQGAPVKVVESTASGDDDDNVVTTTGAYDRNHRHNRRHGNIGVTTTQQMLQSEYELRKTSFFDQVFDDVNNVLITPFWEVC